MNLISDKNKMAFPESSWNSGVSKRNGLEYMSELSNLSDVLPEISRIPARRWQNIV